MKKRLSVAYATHLLPVVEKYIDYINDIYYTDGLFDSARGGNSMREEDYINKDELKKIRDLGIKLNYVLNPPYINNQRLNKHNVITEHLLKLKEEGLVDIVTINNLILSNDKHFMKIMNDNFETKNSVNNHINTPHKMKEMCERFNFDNIIIDRGVNRDLETLKEMISIANKYGKKTTVLLNEGCLFDCIFKRDCDLTFSSISDTEREDNQIFNCYKNNFKKQNVNYLKAPWMTKEGVDALLDTGVMYKISGRYDPVVEIEKRIRYYTFGDRNVRLRELLDKVLTEKDELYNLNMFDLLEYDMLSKLTNCKNDCLNCNECEKFLEEYKDYQND